MLTFAGIKAHIRGFECPICGRAEKAVVKAYRPKNGLDELHPRSAFTCCDQSVKWVDRPGPWYPSRELVGLSRRNGYSKEADR